MVISDTGTWGSLSLCNPACLLKSIYPPFFWSWLPPSFLTIDGSSPLVSCFPPLLFFRISTLPIVHHRLWHFATLANFPSLIDMGYAGFLPTVASTPNHQSTKKKKKIQLEKEDGPDLIFFPCFSLKRCHGLFFICFFTHSVS